MDKETEGGSESPLPVPCHHGPLRLLAPSPVIIKQISLKERVEVTERYVLSPATTLALGILPHTRAVPRDHKAWTFVTQPAQSFIWTSV